MALSRWLRGCLNLLTRPSAFRRSRIQDFQPRAACPLSLEWLECRLAPALWSGAINSNWSNPGNWVGGAVPTTKDVAIFDDTATGGTDNPSTIDNFGSTVAGIQIKNYKGTITDANASLAVTTSGFLQSIPAAPSISMASFCM